MEAQRYINNKDNIGKKLTFEALYIKNGIQHGTNQKSALLTEIKLNDVEVIDHIWINDHEFAEQLKSKRFKNIKFVGKLKKITKPYTIFETKTDIGIEIVKLLKD